MPVYSASASKSGSARLPLDRSYIVTSSASATATSEVSQSNAQTTADTIAEEVAKSVAENDANIISQTLELSPAGIIKAHNIADFSVSYNFGEGTTKYNGSVSADTTSIIPNSNNFSFYGGFLIPAAPAAAPAGTPGATPAATLLGGRGSIYATFTPTNPVETSNVYEVLISIVNNIDVAQFRGALFDGLKHSMSYNYTIRGTYTYNGNGPLPPPTPPSSDDVEQIVYAIINGTVAYPDDNWTPAQVLANDLSLKSNSCQLLDKGAAVAETQVTNAQIGTDAKKKAVLGDVLEYTLSVQFEDAITSRKFARANATAAALFKGATTAATLGATVA